MKRLFLFATALCLATASFAQKFNETQLRKLQQAEFIIANQYVEEVNEEELVDAAIEGMLKQLDPHSTYVRAKDVERATENLNGSFEGIGVQFNMVDDTLVIVQPVSGGPCERQGIIAGDRIITVNDTTIAGVKMSRESIMSRLRGPKGTKVKLGILRQGVKGINTFTIIRDKIPVYTIDASYMVNNQVGYIRIDSFGMTTYDEFMAAIDKLTKQGMTRLIIDLQSNGGGYLHVAVKLANEFLKRDENIVSQKGKAGLVQSTQNYTADGTGTLQNLPVVVLVDSYSASASEILTGAFQDNDRGLVVGRRTFGKGLVQRPFELVDNSMIRLTTAHYYTPSGRCIQKPYEKGKGTDYSKDIEERLNSGELTNLDSIHFADSLKYSTAYLKRTVYGGGGIMPDYYVPLDTTQYTKLYREISAKGCVINTVMKYLDKHRKSLLKQYKNASQFNEQFTVNDDLLKSIRKEAEKSKITFTEEEFAETQESLSEVIKALMARDLWESGDYYMIINPRNAIFQKGVEVVNSPDVLNIMLH